MRPALLYAAFGTAWILGSDGLLFRLSADLPALGWLSEWKGLMFVAVSAALIYWVARQGHPARPAQTVAPQPTDARLVAVFGLAALTILGTGIVGAISAAGSERAEAIDSLEAVVALKSETWTRWLRERQHEAELFGDDPDLPRLLKAGSPAAPSQERALAAPLQHLCERHGCLDARIIDLPSWSTDSRPADDLLPPHAGHALKTGSCAFSGVELEGRPDQSRATIEAAVPLSTPPGAPRAVLLLRFDAGSIVSELLRLDGNALRDNRIVLSRSGASSWQAIRASVNDVHALTLQTSATVKNWPGGADLGPQITQAFDAVADDGNRVFGAATAPRALGWTLSATIGQQRVYERAWSEIWWIVVADLAALVCAIFFALGIHQRRELAFVRREQSAHREQLRTAHLLESISNGTPDLIYAKDLQGRYVFANAATCRALGQPHQAVVGRDSRDFFSPHDLARIEALNAEIIASGTVHYSEGTLTTAEGPRSYVRTIGPLRDADGRIAGTFGIVHDVTERRQLEERQRLWGKAFESTRDGVMIADANGHVRSVNRAFTEITGYEADEVLGRTAAFLHSGRHDKAFYEALWASLKATGCWRGEIWNRRRDGEIYPEWLTISAVRDDAGQVTHYVGVFTDITRIKQDEARLEELVNFDPLTRLPNRRLLLERLHQAIANERLHGGRTGVLYVDLDGFKTVNDSLGHPAGDELLKCIAQRLRACLRPEQTLGRLGGDEFLIIVEAVQHPESLALLARQLLDTIGEQLTLSSGRDAYVTASIGISVHPDDGSGDATELLRDADAAMYRAKDLGRRCFCFYTQELNALAVSKLDMEAALSRALPRDELRLYFQPKVGVADGRINGAEALLRWQRGDEMVPPGQFISLAESSNLILDIGAWVIDRACGQLRQWRDLGLPALRVAVNVAARQFAANDLDRVVSQALARHGVPAHCLELELTESMLIHEPERGISQLQRLRDIGVKLSLDDFGTGYSSLSYLRQFPIDALKIDKSFVDQIGVGDHGSAIVDAVIDLAHRLGLTVVAEGVETEAQIAHLRTHGCDDLQGYALGRPMTAEAFEARCRDPDTGLQARGPEPIATPA